MFRDTSDAFLLLNIIKLTVVVFKVLLDLPRAPKKCDDEHVQAVPSHWLYLGTGENLFN